jgi:hypothetical protein
MSDYGPPPPPQDPNRPQPGRGYPDPQYPPGGGYPPPPPSGPSAFTGLAAKFGERLTRRPEPRFTVAIAAAGAVMTLFGVLLWGGDYFGGGVSDGGSTDRNLLGAGLAAAVTVVGYVLVISSRRGPLATAGVVAGGLGLPITIAFLTLDLSDYSGGFPINFDAVFWVSVVAWLATYLFVPGAQGHTFFVFLIADGLFTYVLTKNTSSVSADVLAGGGPRFHGLGTIAAIGLVFGLGYYLVAFLLDRAGRHGPATGLVYPAFAATGTGIIAWSPDLHRLGTGIVTILVGAAVCWYGGTYGRRVTCFASAAAVVLGIGLLVAEASPDDATAAGITFVLVGVAVVAGAVLLASVVGDRDDMDPEATVRSR